MNTFKRILVVAALVLGAFYVAAPAQAAHHIKPRVCKTLLYKTGPKNTQCRKQGWFYDRGHYVETDGRVVYWGTVIGPKGRVYVNFPYHEYGDIR